VFSYFLLTKSMAFWRWARSTSQTAATRTCLKLRKEVMLPVPIEPTPMQPMTVRLLGATVPFVPNADAGRT
jgi:hypothetical protein